MNFVRETVYDLWDEIQPLLELHWEEIAHYQDIPLEVDKDSYLALEDAGMLRCYTVRDAADLIGYAIFMVRNNIHYKSSKQAVQDVLYLSPEYRGKEVGIRFIDWCDKQLAEDGVQVVYHHVKVNCDFSPALKPLGYELIETVHGRRLWAQPQQS